MEKHDQRVIPNVLTIAGVDPSGGAGVLADIKAMSALGAYGCGVIAALTAQNTKAVTNVLPIPADFVVEQLETLFEDVRIDAVKIGMLGGADVINAVADVLTRHRPKYIVLDPVMIAKSGDRLLEESAVDALKVALLPLTTVLTPNLPEASTLLGRASTRSLAQMHEMLPELYSLMGENGWLYLKGGHLSGEDAVDLLYNATELFVYSHPRVHTENTHGTGCSLSSAIAALLPQCRTVPEACQKAKDWLSGAISHADALKVGSGHGPVSHFWQQWKN